ncbi:MAG: BsuBI/PstI family type II restriction endonuclease [Oscillochloridaceae bacterium umkhey_bin13]
MIALATSSLSDQIELLRLHAGGRLDLAQRKSLGQFFTPAPLARLMGSLLPATQPRISLLDAGAGVGSLLGAAVEALLAAPEPPRQIAVTAYELDTELHSYVQQALQLCQDACTTQGIAFQATLIKGDFIDHAVGQLRTPLFATNQPTYDAAILNPPYKKLGSTTQHRRLLRSVGIESSNLYTAFLALAIKLLNPDGTMVAITPRSFCNGPYFRPFRTLLLEEMALQRLDLFESREQLFQDDAVLQENLILTAVKHQRAAQRVLIAQHQTTNDDLVLTHEVPYEQVVRPDDPEQFIHIVTDPENEQIARQVRTLPGRLSDLGIMVSTGRVVDFRAKIYLRTMPEPGTTALIYPLHLINGTVHWPKLGAKKANAIVDGPATADLLIPNGYYVLIKRFSSKEEARRVRATVYDPATVRASRVGFENHLNYYHSNGQGIPVDLARGLAAYLNSTLVDQYVRQFSGHTQVNATDLRKLPYPSYQQLVLIGQRIGSQQLAQPELDALIHQELFVTNEADDRQLLQQQRLAEAIAVLRDLGFPRAQLNDRSALTLLALLDLKPGDPWPQTSAPLCGITPMMDFFAQHYGKQYKPNTRETVRRQTVHQFLEAGLIEANPDDPERPVNSPKAVYQITEVALDLLQTYTTPASSRRLYAYKAEITSLRQRYAQERAMHRIPVQLPSGEILSLSPGGQNTLIPAIIHEFAPRFTPGCEVLYIGDTDEKFVFFARQRALELGIHVDRHGKMPDVVLYYGQKHWLVLIEAVTSHGPIDAKRKAELAALFQPTQLGLVFVTTFLTRQAMREYLPQISWETEVWVVESPAHLIHFNGERFLGPY